MSNPKKLKTIFENLTASSSNGNILTYDILLLEKELCIQITGNSRGGIFDKNIFPVFFDEDNDMNGYNKNNFIDHISGNDPQKGFLKAIRQSIKKNLVGV